MISKHLKFEQFSDLIDDILVEEEKEYCLTHISQCEECKKEYESLLKCQTLLSSLNKENLPLPDFSQSTITIYKSRERRKLLMKVIPAIAASLIIVTGIGFIKAGQFNKSNSNFAVNFADNNYTQKIIECIGSCKGRIIYVDHSYIDTEFDQDMLKDLERLLQKNQIKHTNITSPIFINPSENNMNDMTLAGAKKTNINDFNYTNYPSLENGKIRVRIFKN